MQRWWWATALAAGLVGLVSAQPVYRGSEIFPPEEFAARRQQVMTRIGDAAAIVIGTTEPAGEKPLRQNSQFFYLTGVVEPRAVVIVDGRSKTSTLFLLPRNERREVRQYGPALSPGAAAARDTGIESVVSRETLAAAIAQLAADRRVVYMPFRAEVLGSESSGDPSRLWAANQQDPWDGRASREEAFLTKFKAAAPNAEIRDLDPLLDAMRAVKSPREIAVIRAATRIAGLGIMEVMRDARVGQFEYELQAVAEFVFKKHGAMGPSYFALVATGRNSYYSHYHKATDRLADGDLIQFDYAPDFKYYQSDVTRVFPANGKFTPRQREFYTIYLRLYQAIMTSIRVHATPGDVMKDAVAKMDRIMAAFTFTDPKIKAAAERFVATQRGRFEARGLGHTVGLEVHDVGGLQAPTLEPGRIFTIEPAMQIEDEHLGLRLEDMILITEAGYENLSAFVPIEMAAIETLMAEPGLSDARR